MEEHKELKCKNCGKLRRNHYDATENIGGIWCYKYGKFSPNDKEYLMRFSS